MVTGAAPLLALTQGDPAGIGPDITLMAWSRRDADSVPPFLYVGDPDVLAARAIMLGLDVPMQEADEQSAKSVFREALPILSVPAGTGVEAGRPDSATAHATIPSNWRSK
jgi:4-hydroxythreonine-4-phosphate dehydrogenase